MIQLTSRLNEAFWVDSTQIESVLSDLDGALIWTRGGRHYYVRETPQEVARRVRNAA